MDGETVTFTAFAPEYAEVYGVPFEFIPTAGTSKPRPPKKTTLIESLKSRHDALITFPRLLGYRYELADEILRAAFTDRRHLTLTTQNLPTHVENAPIVGESVILRLEDLKRRRENEVAFLLTKLVLEKYFRQDGQKKIKRENTHRFDAEVKPWLFPQVLGTAKRWLNECLTLKDNTFPQMLLLIELGHNAADCIYQAIVTGDSGAKTLKPILQPYNTIGTTEGVSFNTTRVILSCNS
ncbi:MAG TPA: hypothetical protein VFF53_03055 [Geobacteraceae bacterium]|nr:hypothetical protein [Geobacteraceae bacterium]